MDGQNYMMNFTKLIAWLIPKKIRRYAKLKPIKIGRS
jgi:hypothetical protein